MPELTEEELQRRMKKIGSFFPEKKPAPAPKPKAQPKKTERGFFAGLRERFIGTKRRALQERRGELIRKATGEPRITKTQEEDLRRGFKRSAN